MLTSDRSGDRSGQAGLADRGRRRAATLARASGWFPHGDAELVTSDPARKMSDARTTRCICWGDQPEGGSPARCALTVVVALEVVEASIIQ